MTMADTIAVMNEGRIEQMGPPTELYENPTTTFVANFLGQSNLLTGRVTARSGGDAVVDLQGRRVGLPTQRIHSAGDKVHVGVRPEKMQIALAADEASYEGRNSLEGVIVDASFIGVSTQYLVRLPWEQEVSVFAQNIRRDERLVDGAAVVLHWDPVHTFALDAAQDVDAGVELVAEEPETEPEPAEA